LDVASYTEKTLSKKKLKKKNPNLKGAEMWKTVVSVRLCNLQGAQEFQKGGVTDKVNGEIR